jgi:hypothetical protein
MQQKKPKIHLLIDYFAEIRASKRLWEQNWGLIFPPNLNDYMHILILPMCLYVGSGLQSKAIAHVQTTVLGCPYQSILSLFIY